MARNPAAARALGAAICLLALGGCATFSDTIGSTERSLARQQPKLALAEYEKLKPAAADRALHLMNKGLLQRMTGDYTQSTRTLEEAKKVVDNLRAVSLREQALSLVVNDATQSFLGEEYEQVMVHTYLALNYLEEHRLEAARVEALQVDVLLRELAQGSSASKYTEDAFARYLTGIVYEEQGEWSDAMIAYRKAYEAYRGQRERFGVGVPDTLKHDLIRLADRMGLTEEAERYRESFGIRETLSAEALAAQGELVVTLHGGLAPVKREMAINMTNPNTGRMLRLALPQYRSRPPLPFAYARVSVGAQAAKTSRVENIDAIAIKSLQDRMPAITARTLARMIAKDQIARKAGEQGSGQGAGLLGVAVNFANVLTERADTRSWFTLPREIHLARVPLPPGEHRGRIELLAPNGSVVQSTEFRVALRAGEKRYLSQHWIPPNIEVKP